MKFWQRFFMLNIPDEILAVIDISIGVPPNSTHWKSVLLAP